MPIRIYPGDDDQYDGVDFSEPPEDPEKVAELWREIAEASRERQRDEDEPEEEEL